MAVLGPTLVTVGSDTVALRRKERELIAALALHRGGVVDDESLVAALWGDAAPPSAGKSLQVHVTRLRSALGAGGAGPDGIERVECGYRLGAAVQVDADRFERIALDPAADLEALRGALSEWRGEPYLELSSWPAASVDRQHLHGLRCLIEERLAEATLTESGARYSLPSLERLAAAEPLREHRWAMLARALASEGRNVEALRTIQHARTTLRETAGLDPGPELLEIEREVLEGGPPPAALTRTKPVTPEPSAAVVVDDSPAHRSRRPVREVNGRRPGWMIATALVAVVAVVGGWIWLRPTPGASSATDLTASAAASSTDVSIDPTTIDPTTIDPTTTAPTTSGVESAPAFSGPVSDPAATLTDVSCDTVTEIAATPIDAQGPRTAATRCAQLSVAQRRDQPAGPRVRLAVVIEPSPSGADSAMPVVSIGEFRALDRPAPGTHVALALRGAGGSDPVIDCPELVEPWFTAIGPQGPTPDGLVEGARACASRLAADGVDVTAYDSRAVADDVADLARLLGVDAIQVEAVGAIGTQVAERLVQRHPGLVSSVLLQDPQPSGVALVDVVAATLARTWRSYVELCAADAGCSTAYPALASAWDSLSEVLAATPLQLRVDGDPPIDVNVDPRLMQLALTFAFDVPATMPLIAGLISQGAADIGVQFLAGTVRRIASATGEALVHLCADQHPYRNRALAEATGRLAGPFALVTAWYEMYDGACAGWPVGAATASAPPTETPMLAVDGSMSPFLADEWVVRLLRSWPAGRVLTLPTVTFGTDASIPVCLDRIVSTWWTSPDALDQATLDACVAASPPIAFAGTG